MTEAQEQIALMKWSVSVRRKYPELKLLHHIPNGGTRDSIEGRHLKLQGVKRGVPDMCLPVPRNGHHGLYIELKTTRGHPSPDQLWWLNELFQQGYVVCICRGWQEAADVIEGYLNGTD